MAIRLQRDSAFQSDEGEQLALECAYCGVYANMTPISVPDAAQVIATRPKHVGLVYQCDACKAPVFLRFAVKEIDDNEVELYRNFAELERPSERFPFSYLPQETEQLFREALSCYSGNNFNAFASMCRRTAGSMFRAMGDGSKMRAFDEVMIAKELAGIDEESFAPIKKTIFDGDSEFDMPVLNRVQAGVLLEVMKDLLYQSFVRRGKLTRALKVRQFFVQDGSNDFATSA